MKKMENRAILCLLLVLAIIAGLTIFVVRFERDGGKWASFYANKHIYKDGHITVGRIYDRNGILLMENTEDGVKYNEDTAIRKSTLQVVGDPDDNISTAASVIFKDRIVGYDRVTGVGSLLKTNGGKLELTIDANINKTAYKALSGRNGFVSVYNWKTGEIICLVSTPTVDPESSAQIKNASEGTYINKIFSSTFTPGSIFKLVTMAAVLENKTGLEEWNFTCTGSTEIDGEKITCPKKHGEQTITDALANSCNCAFATLAVELGPKTMNKYVEKLGLINSYNVDGIETARGSFNFDTYNINLGWAGIGQFEDMVNPLSMMVYMGAIAGGGEAAEPTILLDDGLVKKGIGTVKLLSKTTAEKLQDMTRNNVIKTYKDDNYQGLELHAKSGTAETIDGVKPHAWFVGYSGDYAFAVCVENGGYGSSVAGPIANTVMQEIKKSENNR